MNFLRKRVVQNMQRVQHCNTEGTPGDHNRQGTHFRKERVFLFLHTCYREGFELEVMSISLPLKFGFGPEVEIDPLTGFEPEPER